MKISIVYTPDPVYMNPFIFEILKNNKKNVSCVLATDGSIVSRRSTKDKFEYIIALLFILGFSKTVSNFIKIIENKFSRSNKIQEFCNKNKIDYHYVSTINSNKSKNLLKNINADIIFNQSQHIIKKDILSIPKIGILNRHGALLPKYRGRLSPFWQLYNKETYGGITYHLVNENIDDGPIVIQKKIKIEKSDNFNTLIDKMFKNAVELFPEAINKLKNSNIKLTDNDRTKATYYSTPKIKNALIYRIRTIIDEIK